MSGGAPSSGPRRPNARGAGALAGRLYGIADAGLLGAAGVAPAVAAMTAAGIQTVQIRAKSLSGADFHRLIEGCCRAVEGRGARLWIDDRADLAALFPVAGLHLGQRDLPPGAARRVVGGAVAIGLSTHGEGELAAAAADPEVDLVAVGPIFPTASKERPDPVVGLGFLSRARALTAKPLVAIGGIDAANLPAVLAAGADAAVVLGALCRGDVAANSRRLVAAVGCASS
jgi:thiamine-phosphate pyrophosphorylase